MTSEVTLFGIEERLTALIESEDLVPAEMDAEYQAELAEALLKAVAKRDAVANYITALMVKADAAKAELESHTQRLKKREERFRRAAATLSEYVLRIIQENVPEPKKGARRLEGAVASLVAKKCPASVEVGVPALVPAEYCKFTVRPLTFAEWRKIQNTLRETSETCEAIANLLVSAAASEPSKAEVRKALDSGISVPGAKLIEDKYRLEIT